MHFSSIRENRKAVVVVVVVASSNLLITVKFFTFSQLLETMRDIYVL